VTLGLTALALGSPKPRWRWAGFPCPGREPGSRLHVRTPGAWAACSFAGSDPRAHVVVGTGLP